MPKPKTRRQLQEEVDSLTAENHRLRRKAKQPKKKPVKWSKSDGKHIWMWAIGFFLIIHYIL